MTTFFGIIKRHNDFNKKFGTLEEVNQRISIEEIRLKCKKVYRLPSKHGQKWVIPLEIIERIVTFDTEKVDSCQNCPGTLALPGLELKFLVRGMRLQDMSFITVNGMAGYIGLSANHLDGWHIGTPNFALSKPLVEAMECLCKN